MTSAGSTPTLGAIVVPVTDLAAATSVYAALLGQEPTTDAPYYVGFSLPGLDLGLDPNGHQQGSTGPVAFWDVPDIAVAIEELVAAGSTVQKAAADVGGGMQVATLLDGDNNPIGLRQSGA